MGKLVRIKEKYQVTIPAALRRQLSLHQGDYLEVSLSGDGIVLRPQQQADALPRRSGIVDFLMTPRPASREREDIDATLSADRGSWGR